MSYESFPRLGEEPDALHTAAFDGNLEKVKSLLVAGSDIHSLDEQGWNALHGAVHCVSSDDHLHIAGK